jgi:hypothetical protein
MSVFKVPNDYLKVGLFTDAQKSYYQSIMNAERNSTVLDSKRANLFWSEFFGGSGADQCNSWFMDTFLRLLEGASNDIGALSCMFSETFSSDQTDARFVDRVSESAFDKIARKKLYEKRFLVSFFNLNSHWHWYIIDNVQKVCYIGDSFNQHAYLENAQEHVQPPPLLNSLLSSYRIAWKTLTGAQVTFKTRAVACPPQAFGDGISCGQLACASVIAFLSRVFHDNLPVHRYSEQLLYPNDPVFIKRRLVMSFAYASFEQPLNLIIHETAVPVPLAEDLGNNNNTTCFRTEVFVPCQQTDFELPPFQFPESLLVQAPAQTFTKFKDPVALLTSVQPNYFSKQQSVAKSKVLICCEINENWNFQSYTELLVAVVASCSNVNKKGVSTDSNPKNQAITDTIIAKAALIWEQQKHILLDRFAWKTELNRTQYNEDFTKIKKSERFLIKSNGIWRVTQVGFDTYLKVEAPNCVGPCIFSEVQNCKGRKSKSNKQKILTRMNQLTLESPSRKHTWIDLVKDALHLTYVPLSLKVILDIVSRGTPQADLASIRQGVNNGKKAAKKRPIAFYEVNVTIGKTERTFCGLINAQQYRNITPSNEVYTETGKPCIVWKPFIYRLDQNNEYTIPEDVSASLSIPEDCHVRVFSVDTNTNRLYTRLKLFCGTIIEKSCDRDGALGANSMLNYMSKIENISESNVEEYVHFGIPVLRTTKDINPEEYLYFADPFAIFSLPVPQ